MRYTVAPDSVVHSGTGHSMHQQTSAIPTEITAEDFNQVIWSLMAVQEAGGVGAVAFDEDVPASYQALRKAIINLAVPVGVVRVFANGTDPNSIYPGTTWVRYGAGRVVVGLDASDPDFDALGETGGLKDVTLSLAQIPTHQHMLPLANGGGATTAAPYGTATDESHNVENPNAASVTTQRYLDSPEGGGGSHENMPPYIVAAMWTRTA